MKKIFISLLSVFAIGIVFCGTANAQTSSSASVSGGVLVATVNIYNAKIVSQNDRNFSISFDISNRIGAQPQIKYAIQLLDTSSNQNIVDEKVYDEVLSLGENTTVNKIINYTVPSSIPAGTYNLYVLSENESNLILAQSSLGEVNIAKSSASSVEIVPNSCELYANGELLTSSSIVDSTSTITAKCTVNSTYTKSVVLVPNFITKVNTEFGNVASTTGTSSESITIQEGENNISIELPKALSPQNYYVAFSLASADNSIVSNTYGLNYSIIGESGMIRNILFDKTSYKAGDMASIQILTSANVSSTTISLLIYDGSGELCSNQISTSSIFFTTIKVPIIKDCVNPNANVILLANGVVLDTRSYQVASSGNNISSSTPFSIQSSSFGMILISIIILILLVILFYFIYKKNHSVIKSMIIVFFGASLFYFAGNVKADTYTFNGVGGSTFSSVGYVSGYTYDINFNKDLTTYHTGDIMTVIGDYSAWANSNGVRYTNAYINEPTVCGGSQVCSQSSSNYLTGTPYNKKGSETYTLTSYGSYNFIANLYWVDTVYNNYGTTNCSGGWQHCTYSNSGNQAISIPFIVTTPVSMKLDATSTSILSGDSSTISWSSYGADSCTITKNGEAFITPVDVVSACTNQFGSWNSASSTCRVNFSETTNQTQATTYCTNLGGTVGINTGYYTGKYYCTIPASNIPVTPYTSGSVNSGPLTDNTTFIATCSNTQYLSSTSVTVNVQRLTGKGFPSPTCSATSQSITCQPVSSSTDLSYTCEVVDQLSGDQIASEINDGILTTTGALSATTTYVVQCADNSGQLSQTSVNIPQSGLICTPSQSGSADGNIYVNKPMIWTASASYGSQISNVLWPDGTKGLIDNKIYTTIGTKSITGQATVDGNSVSCTGTTTVKMGTSTSSEF
jgi:hypothetical protein